MAKSTLTSKGQVTIPKEVRARLALKEGDRIVFRFDEQGRLILEPDEGGPLGNLPGLLHHLAGERPFTVEEMNEAIRERMREKFGPRAER
jgi:AbrB family looped-hinge helix DNA binding protein